VPSTSTAWRFITRLGRLLKDALRELMLNDPLRMAGATAFFTTFALPPILIILFQILRLVLNPAVIRVELFESLSGIVGPEAVNELAGVSAQWRRMAQNWYITVGGFIFLLFVATTLFKVIKNSMNQVWKIRPHPKRGISRAVRGRFHAILVIVVAGVLFMIGIVAEGVQAFIGSYLATISPILSLYFNSALQYLLPTAIVTLWFMIMFRYLPDGRPEWSVAFIGALLTSILFTLGKIVLHWLLSYSNINTLYGTSTSIVLLLLFVFYSSFILYFGAAFTKIWAIHRKKPITPLPHAMHYKITETEA
jgi:membrane protein